MNERTVPSASAEERRPARRNCRFVMPDGRPCRSSPLTGEDYCLFHSPDHAEEAQEARRLGGLRRRREKALASTYFVEGLRTIDHVQRLLEIATLDALALENSVSRVRALTYVCHTALKCLELGQFEERLRALEATRGRTGEEPAFDLDLDPYDDPEEEP